MNESNSFSQNDSKDKEIRIWNVKFTPLTCNEVVEQIDKWLDEGRTGIHLTGVNPEQVVKAQTEQSLRDAINQSDIVNVDGILTVWGLRLKGYKIKERAATPNIMYLLLDRANEKHESIYLLGSQDWVVRNTAKFIHEHYPQIVIAGYHDGFFKDDTPIIQEIKRLHPRFLYIALPSPQKENLILKTKPMGIADVYYGVGGAFDTMGGKCRRAPRLMQKLNIEWIWRICQNPKQNGIRVIKNYPDFIKLLFEKK